MAQYTRSMSKKNIFIYLPACLPVADPTTLLQDTLEAAYQEAQRRAAAEGDLKRFISYIMHETRNPLSALMLLVGSFQDTLRHMISVSASKRKHRGGKNKTLRDKRMEAARVWNHDQGLGQGGERALPDERPIEAPFLEELHRMEGLNLMMMTKLTKMQTVCDDVLQLQKLELGHLTYSFRVCACVRFFFLPLSLFRSR
uniref:Uncharacterized protein n=1 Tax=Chromera velia CCMP2878 TaxID=1169474 RepID=A0A0K6S8Z9_9ALVE|eukprot:Cvel_6997.t2-p1 / transcript=Cvel_6997.t2 / gene=Cvel_6997 / organism=Chromera_velia_CCMP2878 / gene_product=Ethylene receptor 1, putative / transcript_product=Ethylene receptor 1, putative / location=Cvel_scaffold356:29672-30265(-) / protein_length=198 / sequence_SO=supercontig / SO=protein_coding / is_pseudo=false